eukprot:8243127-Alexandrium_andersonii.AAC.1
MAKAAQTLADTEGFAVSRLGGKSAFNPQGRAAALNRLNDVSPGLANALAQFYGTTSSRWVQEGDAWRVLC